MKKLFNHTFDAAISLGDTCRCAKYLRMMKLRDCSSPFDWVRGSTFEKRIDLLCSGFADYLLLENLRASSTAEVPKPGADDRRVYDIASGFVFPHDFPTTKPVAEGYAEVRAKYDRRIARLLRRLRGYGSYCLVWWSHDEHLSDEMLVWALQKLGEHFMARLSILVLENGPTASPVVKTVDGNGRIVRVSARLVASQEDMNGNRRAIKRLLAGVPVNGAVRARLGWGVRRVIVNLFVWYIPFGRLRRWLRDRLRSVLLQDYERR